MVYGVQCTAAGAGLRHAERLALGGNEPVAGQKGPGRAACVAGRVLAADSAAALFDGGTQLGVGGGVGLIDGRTQKRDRGAVGLQRGAVGLAVQPVRQTADDDRARLRHRQRQVKGRLPPVSAGAAGAHHAHAALPVQAGRVAGQIQHQRQVGQVAQRGGVGVLIGGQQLDPAQQAVVEPLLKIKGGRILQLGKGAGRQAGRRGLGACAQQVVQLGRVGVKRKQLLRILARRADGVRQPEPGQCFVHGGCPLLSSRLHSGGQRTARPTPAVAP